MNIQPVTLAVPPAIAVALLNVVAATPSDSVLVAGGCLRDTYFGVQYRSINLFAGPDFDPRAWRKALGLDWSVECERSERQLDEYRGYFGLRVESIWKATRTGGACNVGALVQVIVWNAPLDPAELMGGFDFGFNQIAYDGAQVVTGEAFRRDAANNTATYMLDLDDPRAALCYARAHRFAVRYPGRRFVWPDGRDSPVTAAQMDAFSGPAA